MLMQDVHTGMKVTVSKSKYAEVFLVGTRNPANPFVWQLLQIMPNGELVHCGEMDCSCMEKAK